jgi:zinc protease
LALRIESIRMRGVFASENAWARERGAIEQEVARDLSEPEYVVYTHLLETLFAGTPYAHDALGTHASFERTTGAMLKIFYLTQRALLKAIYPQGDPKQRHATPKSVMSLTLADMEGYYRQVFRPDMTTIVVIGKIDPGRARALVERYFGGWKAEGPKPDIDLPRVPPNPPSVTAVPDRSRIQDEVILSQTLGMDRFDPDYYPLQLGNHVLGGGFYATRLYRDLRERNGLVYTVGASISAGRTRVVYLIEYACDPKDVSRARAIVERDLREMQADPLDAASLLQAKSLLMTETALDEASVSDISAGLLDRATLGLPLDEPVRAARRLRLKDLVQVTQGPEPH